MLLLLIDAADRVHDRDGAKRKRKREEKKKERVLILKGVSNFFFFFDVWFFVTYIITLCYKTPILVLWNFYKVQSSMLFFWLVFHMSSKEMPPFFQIKHLHQSERVICMKWGEGGQSLWHDPRDAFPLSFNDSANFVCVGMIEQEPLVDLMKTFRWQEQSKLLSLCSSCLRWLKNSFKAQQIRYRSTLEPIITRDFIRSIAGIVYY